MGGRRLAPGQAVDALDEAIGVIRAIWDADRARRRAGRRRALPGGRREARPRARRTTSGSGSARTSRGCCADRPRRPTAGCRRWRTCRSPATSAGVQRAHRRGRAAAGRDPAEMRRLLNVSGRVRRAPARVSSTGPPQQWARGAGRPRARRTASAPSSSARDDPERSELFAAGGGPRRPRTGRRRARRRRPAPAGPAGDRTGRSAGRAGRTGVDVPIERARVGRLGVRPARRRRRAGSPVASPHPRRRYATATTGSGTSRPGPVAPPAPRARLHPAGPGRRPAPRRRPRPPARRAERAARPASSRSRAGLVAAGRARGVHQRDDHAAEQLDAGRVLRVVLPRSSPAPHAGGRRDLPAPAARRSAARPGDGPAGRRSTTVIHDVLERRRPRPGRAGRRTRDELAELQRAVDLLTDTLLSHLSYEERETRRAVARLGFYPGQL